MFGAPVILHSDDEIELITSIITEIRSKWNDVKIVKGNPAHSHHPDLKQIKTMIDAWVKKKRS